ncbi:Protein N-acetyltransferase, RimJ/RimL family [Actinacidiphila yanglinensis]|uniref:Protein N-acetyltransferase, RimJ/RimL family n=1 Tax=Actinacidiphila yanglinensis TaxID=310779 RepID=A0A1H6D6C0_9ACTN|nr:GNAT family N-acetyltransferase [Actinacidiphila yanglinensis]SEG80832.1 Protein N-acetyltransferase, RimJ/RimL family [Actinacidiphila yanglinensis]
MTRPPLPVATERLTLRRFTVDDLDDLHAYQALPEVARYLYRPPLTREQCAQALTRRADEGSWAADGDDLVLAVCPPGEERVLGEVVLKLASAEAGQAEIGWVFHPAHGGRGYATEAASAAAALAFAHLGVHRLFARLDVLNRSSVGVCERLGMRREAHLVENDRDGDRWGSEYVYAVLAREWRNARAGSAPAGAGGAAVTDRS